MQGAIVFRWAGYIAGREAASLEVRRDAVTFLDKAVADDRIAGYDWFMSAQGDTHYLIIRGDLDRLVEFSNDPNGLDLRTRSMLTMTGFQWGYYVTGEGADMMAAQFETAIAKFR